MGAVESDDPGAAFEWFFRGEYQAVLRTVFLVVGDRETAGDLTQEAFIRLFGHWKKVSKYDRPEAWVRQAAVRLGIQYLRRQRLQQRFSRIDDYDVTFDPAVLDVQRAVKLLPPMQRACVVLFYFEDRPSAEIAQILDCSDSTVRAHLHKARHKLASVLEGSRVDVD